MPGEPPVGFGRCKPAPEIFQHALDVSGVDVERCLDIGDDSAADHVAAGSMSRLLIDPDGCTPIGPEGRLASIFDPEPGLVERRARRHGSGRHGSWRWA